MTPRQQGQVAAVSAETEAFGSRHNTHFWLLFLYQGHVEANASFEEECVAVCCLCNGEVPPFSRAQTSSTQEKSASHTMF